MDHKYWAKALRSLQESMLLNMWPLTLSTHNHNGPADEVQIVKCILKKAAAHPHLAITEHWRVDFLQQKCWLKEINLQTARTHTGGMKVCGNTSRCETDWTIQHSNQASGPPLTGGRVRGVGHWGPLPKVVKVTVWDTNNAQCVSWKMTQTTCEFETEAVLQWRLGVKWMI